MDFYHGSVMNGLTELQPFASEHNNIREARVYLTISKQLALHYIWNYKKCAHKMPMLDIRKDGVLVFQEMFSGALEYFYGGLQGYIYHCVGDYALDNEARVFTCATSKTSVPIKDCEFIDDVYARIMEYEKYGLFIYEKFEELPPYRHDTIRGVVMRTIKQNNLLANESHPSLKLYKEKFPRYWEEAKILQKHNLL